MSKVEPMELIFSLIGYPNETEWLEFKENNDDPVQIGKDISALANAAAVHERSFAYKIWGVSDDSRHELKGTSFDPLSSKGKGNQDLLIWLKRMLSSNVYYEFESVPYDGMNFIVLKVNAAVRQPVYFEKAAYIRDGSSTTRIEPGSEKERELWRRLQSGDFELEVAQPDVKSDEIESLLDLDAFFGPLGLSRPASLEGMLAPLVEQEVVRLQDNGRYGITNLGALLLARRMSAFPRLRKRSLRIIRYAGDGNFEILDERTFDVGYVRALQDGNGYLQTLTAVEEQESGAFRKIRYLYPRKAIRELLSNTVIHQDLADGAAGPVVSVYDGRLEFTNPGVSLIAPERVLNAPSKARNTHLVGLLRQMDLCEEGGTGWDIAVAACEAEHMLPPRIISSDDIGTKVTLYAGVGFGRMQKQERKDATYWHACLQYAQDKAMGNQSLRERFGLEASQKNTVAISRLIRECCDDGLIKVQDESVGAKYKRYIPFWA